MKRYKRLGFENEFNFYKSRITRGCFTLFALSFSAIVVLLSTLINGSAFFYPFFLPVFLSSFFTNQVAFYSIYITTTILLATIAILIIFYIEKWKISYFYLFVVFYFTDFLLAIVSLFFRFNAISTIIFHLIIIALFIETLYYAPKYIKSKIISS